MDDSTTSPAPVTPEPISPLSGAGEVNPATPGSGDTATPIIPTTPSTPVAPPAADTIPAVPVEAPENPAASPVPAAVDGTAPEPAAGPASAASVVAGSSDSYRPLGQPVSTSDASSVPGATPSATPESAAGSAPAAASAPAPKPTDRQPKKSSNLARTARRAKLIAWLVVALLLVASGGAAAFLIHANNSRKPVPVAGSASDYDVTSVPLGNLSKSGVLALDQASELSINGQLLINNSFVLTPTTTPTNPQTGQFYLNSSNNLPYYFNGSKFENLATGDEVNSLGPVSRTSAGNGLTINGNQLTNTGVLSLQGQTGAVTLTAGGGISINGTTISSSGVSSLTGTSNQINVSAASGDITVSLPQDIATGSAPTFAAIQVGTLTARPGDTGLVVGDTTQDLSLQGADTTVSDTNGGFTTQLAFATPTANSTVIVPDNIGGTICTTSGNCGTGSASVQLQPTSPGTPQTGNINVSGTVIASAFNGDGTNVTNVNAAELNGQMPSYYLNASNITSGTLAVANGGTGATTAPAALTNLGAAASGVNSDITSLTDLSSITPSGSLAIGSATEPLTLQGSAATVFTAADSGFTTTLGFTTPTADASINLPNASGTVAVAASGPLELNSDGNLSCPNCLVSSGGSGGTVGVVSVNSFTGAVTVAAGTGLGVTNNSGTVTIAADQDISTTATPTFGGLTLNGDLGVGVGVPQDAVDVVGDVNVSGSFKINGVPICTSGGCTSGGGSGNYVQNGTSIQSANFAIQGASSGNTVALVRGALGQTANIFSVQNSGSTNFLAVSAGGNVGVDTASPNYPLDVNGNINTNSNYLVSGTQISTSNLSNGSSIALLGANQSFTGTNGFTGSGNGTTVGTLFQNAADSTTAFQIQNAAGTSNLFDVDTTHGEIGIGTTPGTYTLNVQGSAGTVNVGTELYVGGTPVCSSSGCVSTGGSGSYVQNGTSIQAANFAIQSVADADVGAVIKGHSGTQSADLLDVQTSGGANQFSVSAGGVGYVATSLGVGVPSPSYTLETSGTIDINNALGSFDIDGTPVCSLSGCAASGGSGNYIQNTTTLESENFSIQSNAASNAPTAILQQAAGQTGDLLDLNASGGGIVAAISPSGQLRVGSATAYTSALNVGTNTTTAAGGITFGTDTDLYRSGSSTLKTDGTLQAGKLYESGANGTTGLQLQSTTAASTSSTNLTFTDNEATPKSISLAKQGNNLVVLDNSGNVQLGFSPSTDGILFGNTLDTDLYRSGTDALTTDGSLTVAQGFTGTGTTLFKNTSNSTTALQIQNAAGTNLFVADTTDQRIGIDTISPPNFPLDVNGTINTSTQYDIGGSEVCNSAGCNAASGSGFYIQNGTTVQAANFAIQSTATGNVGAVIEGATGQTADLFDLQDVVGSTATNVLTVGSTGNTLIEPSTNSTTAFRIQSAGAAATLIDADTSNLAVGIDGASTTAGFALNVTGTINASTQIDVGGVQIASSNLSDSANLAKLNGTGPQTFTGNNDFTGSGNGSTTFGTLFQNAVNSTTAFAVQNAGGVAALSINTTSLTTTVQGGTSTPTLGTNLTPDQNMGDSNWTSTGTPAWTTTSTSATNNSGNSTALTTNQFTPASTTQYQVSYTISGTPAAGTLTVTMGGQTVASYNFATAVGGQQNFTDTRTITTAAGGAGNAILSFTPNSSFVGTISAVSVETITSTPATLVVNNSSGNPNIQVIASSSNTNDFIGLSSGSLNSAGTDDVALGTSALQGNTTGANNTAVGYLALESGTSTSNNSAFGANALAASTFGVQNTAVGSSSLKTDTTGSLNTAVGYNALENTTNAIENTAVGEAALFTNTTGGQNTAVGQNALNANLSGIESAALGYEALDVNTASDNSALGGIALLDVTSGTNNTGIGYNTGRGNSVTATTTGSGNTFVGADASQGVLSSAYQVSNSTALGFDSSVNQSNAVILGCTTNAANPDGCGTTSTVGIGSQYAPSALTVNPSVYGTYGTTANGGGSSPTTITESGTTGVITGSGTTFTSNMVGGTIYYANGTSTGTIASYTSTTQITAVTPLAVSAGSAYTIVYGGFNVNPAGTTYLQPTTDSTTAFKIQNAANTTTLFDADTTHGLVGIGAAPTSGGAALQVTGALSATTTISVGTSTLSPTSLVIGGTTVCTSAGCTTGAGSGSYINNGTTLQTAANFNIQSTASSNVAASIQGASGQTADLLDLSSNPSGTAIKVVTVGATGNLLVEPSTNTATAFQVANATGNPTVNTNTSATNNLLKYPSFASGSFTTASTGWAPVSPGTIAQNTTAANSYDGIDSLDLTTTSSNGGAQTSAFTGTEVGGTYFVSFYVMLGAGTSMNANAFTITLNDGSNHTCSPGSRTLTTVAFARISCSTTTSSNLASLTIAQNDSTARSNIYISDVQLQTVGVTDYQSGTLQLPGTTVTSPTVFENSANSNTAFQVQNNIGTSAINVDTTTNTTTLQVAAGYDTTTLGSNLATCTDFTNTNSPCTVGMWTTTGWTAATSSATHVTGNTSALSTSQVTPVNGTTYEITYTVTPNNSISTTLTTTFGGQTAATYTIASNQPAFTESKIITASSNSGNLTFTPSSTFIGAISAVTIQQVTQAPAAVLVVNNASGTANIQVTASSSTTNDFIGLSVGQANSAGIQDVGLGTQALQNNTTGSDNSALGYQALQSNTVGTSNVALGDQALKSNTTGFNNTAVGYEALQNTTTGYTDVAVGFQALSANTIGVQNTAIGYRAAPNVTGNANNTTAVGFNVLSATTATSNTAVGAAALQSDTTGAGNTALGVLAGYTNNSANADTTGADNTFIGFNAGQGQAAYQTSSSTALGWDSAVNQSNAVILGCTNGVNGCSGTSTVGIGSQYAPNSLTVSPGTYGSNSLYGTNTAAGYGTTISQTTTTITGSGTAFTSAMTGGTITYSDGTTGTLTYVSGTSLTSSLSKTVAAGSSYTINYATGTTITQSSSSGTVTGNGGTAFTSGMVGGTIYYNNGTTGTITAVASNTSLTSSNTTGGFTTASYTIVYGGFNVTNTGTAYLQPTIDSTTAFQIQNAANTTNVLDVDTTHTSVGIDGASTSAGFALNVTGTINTSTQYDVGGVQIASSNLSDSSNLAKLNANNIFTASGNNTSVYGAQFENAANSTTAFVIQNQSGAALLTADTTNMKVTVTNLVITASLTVNGHVITGNSSGTTTAAVNGNAGTGGSPVCTITGNDTGGQITLTTGTSAWSSGTQCTVTFANSYAGTAPHPVITTANSTDTSTVKPYVTVPGSTPFTTFTISFINADSAQHTYVWNYFNAQ